MLPALSFPVAAPAARKSYNQGGQQGDLVSYNKIMKADVELILY